jgi:hypothetical protein
MAGDWCVLAILLLALVLRFEADNQANLDKIKNKFKTFLSSQDIDNNI